MPRDWNADAYERLSAPQTRWGEAVVGWLDLTGDERVMDAGCGTGRVTAMLLERLRRGRVVALDGSPSMIERARERLGDERVEYVIADLMEPLPGSRRFLLQNDEDFGPNSPVHIIVFGSPQTVGVASEVPWSRPIWTLPGHELSGDVVRAMRRGCEPGDYLAQAAGSIVVVHTIFERFDPVRTGKRMCRQATQERAAKRAGAAAIVHDFISTATSPRWWNPDDVNTPVLFTDHTTAEGMVAAGTASLQGQEPSWGFIRVFDATAGQQVAKVDGADNVHAYPPRDGFWSVHNSEVMGDRSYASWYSDGLIALDLTPLNGTTPADRVMVGRFVPAGAPSHSSFIPDGIPNV